MRYEAGVNRVVIVLASELELVFVSKRTQGLEHARPADLADGQITPSGLGIHVPHQLAFPCFSVAMSITKRYFTSPFSMRS